MNEIIWALLAIDVLAKAHVVIAHSIFAISAITALGTLVYTMHSDIYGTTEGLLQSLRKGLKPVVITLTTLTTLYTLIPSKQTMQIALGLYATNQAVTYVTDTGIAKQAFSTLELKLKSIEQDLKKDLEEQDSGE